MQLLVFIGIIVGFSGNGWAVFWSALLASVVVSAMPRLSGGKRLRAAEAATAEITKVASDRITELKDEIERLSRSNIELQGKIDYARRKSRRAGMQAVFDQYLDAKNIFDQNLKIVLEERRKEKEKEQSRFERRRHARQKAPATNRMWWEVLELTPSASIHEVKIAYRKLAMIWHPDRNQGDGTRMAEINRAKDEAEAALVA